MSEVCAKINWLASDTRQGMANFEIKKKTQKNKSKNNNGLIVIGLFDTF